MTGTALGLSTYRTSAPRPEELEDRVPIGYYDQAINQRGIQAAWHRLKFERVREAMGEFDSHLDIACGPGTFLGLLDGNRSIGVDLAIRQLEYAQKTHGGFGERWVACSANALPFAANSFDVVTSIELIEHIPYSAALSMLESVYETLKPGGRLVLTTPNFRSPWLVLEPLVSIIGQVDYRIEHITRYHRKRLSCLLTEAGFTQANVEPFQLAAPFLAPLGKKISDTTAKIERAGIERHFGCLLMAVAIK